MMIVLREYEIAGITTLIDNGKRIVAVDIDGKVHVVFKQDVIVISPN